MQHNGSKRDAGDSETMSVAPGLSGEVSGSKRNILLGLLTTKEVGLE